MRDSWKNAQGQTVMITENGDLRVVKSSETVMVHLTGGSMGAQAGEAKELPYAPVVPYFEQAKPVRRAATNADEEAKLAPIVPYFEKPKGK